MLCLLLFYIYTFQDDDVIQKREKVMSFLLEKVGTYNFKLDIVSLMEYYCKEEFVKVM